MRLILLFVFTVFSTVHVHSQGKGKQDFYQMRIYHCTDLKQVTQIEEYAGKQLLPYLHKNGIKHVGIFTPVNNDTLRDKKLFIWIPYSSLEQMKTVEHKFESTDAFGNDPLIHNDSSGALSPYGRIEVSLSSAFRFMTSYDPKTHFPRSPDNIYEYRSYESATEALHLRKVHMFNEGGEIPLFKRLGFDALFYSRVIAGPRMPNLIYITRFSNMEERNNHWKQFSADPEWKTLSSMPKYANSVSAAEIILMKASSYSDL
jgi:hypothetical protein